MSDDTTPPRGYERSSLPPVTLTEAQYREVLANVLSVELAKQLKPLRAEQDRFTQWADRMLTTAEQLNSIYKVLIAQERNYATHEDLQRHKQEVNEHIRRLELLIQQKKP